MFGRKKKVAPAVADVSARAERARSPQVYRRFLYLDAESVLNFLSVLQGGEVLDRYQASVAQRGSEVGAEINLGALGIPLGARAKGTTSSKLEEQVRLTTTAHSAVAEILRALENADRRESLAELPEPVKLQQLENAVVECAYKAVSFMTPDNPVSPADNRSPAARFFGTSGPPPPGRPFVARLRGGGRADSDWSVAITGHGDHLRVPAEEFRALRHATVLGQAEVVHADEKLAFSDGDSGPALRIVDAATASGSPGPPSTTPDEEAERGAAPTDDAPPFFCRDRLLLRPLCIYK